MEIVAGSASLEQKLSTITARLDALAKDIEHKERTKAELTESVQRLAKSNLPVLQELQKKETLTPEEFLRIQFYMSKLSQHVEYSNTILRLLKDSAEAFSSVDTGKWREMPNLGQTDQKTPD